MFFCSRLAMLVALFTASTFLTAGPLKKPNSKAENYYVRLGIDPRDADLNDPVKAAALINRAYRKAAAESYPISEGAGDVVAFKAYTDAYDVLNSSQRTTYDLSGGRPLKAASEPEASKPTSREEWSAFYTAEWFQELNKRFIAVKRRIEMQALKDSTDPTPSEVYYQVFFEVVETALKENSGGEQTLFTINPAAGFPHPISQSRQFAQAALSTFLDSHRVSFFAHLPSASEVHRLNQILHRQWSSYPENRWSFWREGMANTKGLEIYRRYLDIILGEAALLPDSSKILIQEVEKYVRKFRRRAGFEDTTLVILRRNFDSIVKEALDCSQEDPRFTSESGWSNVRNAMEHLARDGMNYLAAINTLDPKLGLELLCDLMELMLPSKDGSKSMTEGLAALGKVADSKVMEQRKIEPERQSYGVTVRIIVNGQRDREPGPRYEYVYNERARRLYHGYFTDFARHFPDTVGTMLFERVRNGGEALAYALSRPRIREYLFEHYFMQGPETTRGRQCSETLLDEVRRLSKTPRIAGPK